MKKTRPAALAAVIITICLYTGAHAQEFRWQEAVREMDALPFSRAYTDSVIKAHIGDAARQAGLRQVKPGKFVNGETLIYEVGWGPFMAGYLVLTAQNFRGRGLIRFEAKAMTSPFISKFYRARDYSASWVDADGFYPRFFEQHVREGSKYKMDAYIVFDNINGKLYHKRRSVKEYDTPKFTHDYASIMYYVRSMPLNPGDTYEAFMFAAPRTDPVKIRVHNKKETIQTPAGTFNCVIVEPTFIGDTKAFNKKSKIEVWVSDDENKYPVFIKAKAKGKIGAVNAKLVQIL